MLSSRCSVKILNLQKDERSDNLGVMDWFREQVRKRRKELGKTQEQVAIEVGEERHNYSGFENGRRNLNDQKMLLLAKALEVDFDTLIAWTLVKKHSKRVYELVLQIDAEEGA